MANRLLRFLTLALSVSGLIACAQTTNVSAQPPSSTESPSAEPTEPTSGQDLTQLFSRAWQVTDAPSEPALGSMYIFLANGTLLETSCVETYRVATWTIDKETPNVLQVVEDGQPAFNAEIIELTDTTLQLQQTLVLSDEQRELTLTAVDEEFVCPDLPR